MRRLALAFVLLVTACGQGERSQDQNQGPALSAKNPPAMPPNLASGTEPSFKVPVSSAPNMLYACATPDLEKSIVVPAGTVYEGWGKLVGNLQEPDTDPDYHGPGRRPLITMTDFSLSTKKLCAMVKVTIPKGGDFNVPEEECRAADREFYQASFATRLDKATPAFQEALDMGILNGALASDVSRRANVQPQTGRSYEFKDKPKLRAGDRIRFTKGMIACPSKQEMSDLTLLAGGRMERCVGLSPNDLATIVTVNYDPRDPDAADMWIRSPAIPFGKGFVTTANDSFWDRVR